MKALIVSCERPTGLAFDLIKSFQNQNCQTEMMYSPMVCTKWNLFIRIKRRFGMNIDGYLIRKASRFEKKVLKKCIEFKPDVVCDLGAFLLNVSVIDIIKKHCLIVAIMLDRLCFFPRLYKTVGCYDIVYTYSTEDKEFLYSSGTKCKVNYSIGEKYRFFQMHLEKSIDVFFVGSMYPEKDYGYRYELLKKLVKDLPNVKFLIGGKCAPFRRPTRFFEWFFHNKYRKAFINKTLTKYECNEFYNRSKICLSLERLNTGNTWSGRLANILRTGSLIITGSNDVMEKVFGNDIETFNDYDELKRKIIYYLNDEKMRTYKENVQYMRFIKVCEEIEFDQAADIISASGQYNSKKKGW